MFTNNFKSLIGFILTRTKDKYFIKDMYEQEAYINDLRNTYVFYTNSSDNSYSSYAKNQVEQALFDMANKSSYVIENPYGYYSSRQVINGVSTTVIPSSSGTYKGHPLVHKYGDVELVIVFGSSNKPFTEEDCTIDYISQTPTQNMVTSYTSDGYPNIEFTFDFTRSSTATTSLTIGEVGICYPLVYTTSEDLTKAYLAPILIERTPLETPLTLNPGENGAIRYNITCKNFLDVN